MPIALDYRGMVAKPFDPAAVHALAWGCRLLLAAQATAVLALVIFSATSPAGGVPDRLNLAILLWFLSGLLSLLAAVGAGVAGVVGAIAAATGRRAGRRYWRYSIEAMLTSSVSVGVFAITLTRWIPNC